jgi:hypothetical protein
VWPTVWGMSLTVCILYLATLPTAKSADLTPADAVAPVVGDIGTQFEARFGVFDHGVGSAERNTVDINGSIVTPRLKLGVSGYAAYFLPRFQLGGAANLAGRTSFGYADVLFTLPITKWLFFEPFLGGRPTMGPWPRRRRWLASAVRSSFTPGRRLAFPSPSIGECSARLSTCRMANHLAWTAEPISVREATRA